MRLPVLCHCFLIGFSSITHFLMCSVWGTGGVGGGVECVCVCVHVSVPALYVICTHRVFPGSSAGKEYTCNVGDPGSIPGSGRSTGEGVGYPLQDSWASLVAQLVKESTCSVGDLGSIPELGRSPGEGNGYPLQYSDLENSMDPIVHEVQRVRRAE